MTVTVKIEKNVYGGDGLGRLGDGRVCFVAGAFAGETARVEIVEQKKRYVRARLVELVEASPDRQEPGEVVPGMVYAGVSYEAELRMKRDQLENFLWKVCPSVLPLEVIPCLQPLGYRNKVVYHTERQDGRWVLGYRTEPEHRVVDTPHDPLACAAINAELPSIRQGVFALLTQGARAVRQSAKAAENVTIRWTPIDGVKWWLGEPPAGLELHETTDGRRFRVPGDGFYQVNPQVGDRLVKAVREEYAAHAGEAGHILDLYCGVGVFGLSCLAGGVGEGPRLVGVESGRAAIASAKRNAEALGVKANFFCERVGGSLGRIKAGAHHTVIVDPPRGGMEPNVPGWLVNRPAPRILYVSCDPATLVRDLSTLVRAYEIESVKLFDMFPRTARFETLVTLARRGEPKA
ncbi:MAG: class I SAM-dependent RNA methyltransferase [Kiritimatiellia bacterium]